MMVKEFSITRRGFLFLGLMPMALEASPLVDLDRGLGLFSSHGHLSSNNTNAKLMLLHDPEPEPELNIFNQLSTTEFGPIGLEKDLQLSLLNANTNEVMDLTLSKDKKLSLEKHRLLNRFFKDWRTGEVTHIDSQLLSIFLKICTECSGSKNSLRVNIHSAFRSKQTNEALRKNSVKVAKNSMHILGKALDFSVPSLSTVQLARNVKRHSKGGVGVYDTFVHLDSGPRRVW
jgi:uncharacterized protein YcbK (DUF882 family)